MLRKHKICWRKLLFFVRPVSVTIIQKLSNGNSFFLFGAKSEFFERVSRTPDKRGATSRGSYNERIFNDLCKYFKSRMTYWIIYYGLRRRGVALISYFNKFVWGELYIQIITLSPLWCWKRLINIIKAIYSRINSKIVYK